MQSQWTRVDAYFAHLLAPSEHVLDAALQAGLDAGLPAHNVSALQGKLLCLLARIQGAKRILEIGTLGGYSTIWLARGLATGGGVTTLESNPRHAEVARENIARAGLADVVEIRTGPALETLPRLQAEGGGAFDLVFIDADKQNNPAYLAWSLRLARPGTLIIADNVVRNGEVTDTTSTDPSVRGIRSFLSLVAENPALSATAIQTVGNKGYDGFAMAVVGDST